MNKVHLNGNVGSEPELSTANSGTMICKFSLATNDGWGDNKKTNWHRLVIFGKRAEVAAQYINKGARLCITGRIDYQEWEDQDGNKRNSVSIIVDDFDLPPRQDQGNASHASTPSGYTSTPQGNYGNGGSASSERSLQQRSKQTYSSDRSGGYGGGKPQQSSMLNSRGQTMPPPPDDADIPF